MLGLTHTLCSFLFDNTRRMESEFVIQVLPHFNTTNNQDYIRNNSSESGSFIRLAPQAGYVQISISYKTPTDSTTWISNMPKNSDVDNVMSASGTLKKNEEEAIYNLLMPENSQCKKIGIEISNEVNKKYTLSIAYGGFEGQLSKELSDLLASGSIVMPYFTRSANVKVYYSGLLDIKYVPPVWATISSVFLDQYVNIIQSLGFNRLDFFSVRSFL